MCVRCSNPLVISGRCWVGDLGIFYLHLRHVGALLPLTRSRAETWKKESFAFMSSSANECRVHTMLCNSVLSCLHAGALWWCWACNHPWIATLGVPYHVPAILFIEILLGWANMGKIWHSGAMQTDVYFGVLFFFLMNGRAHVLLSNKKKGRSMLMLIGGECLCPYPYLDNCCMVSSNCFLQVPG
jgi:hypothetical protein